LKGFKWFKKTSTVWAP